MKMFFIPVLLVASLAAAQGGTPVQIKESKVVYERAVQMQGMFRGPDSEAAERTPKQITEHFELLFSNNRSLWQPLPDAAAEAATVSGTAGNTLRVARWGGADIVYTDIESGKKITESELGIKNYIVEDSITKLFWKLSEDEKEILGYKVKKATAFRYGTRRIVAMENGKISPQELPDTSAVVAWFAPEIQVAAGPDWSSGLPGLILELDEGGRSMYKAIEISPKANGTGIREPKSGKRISAAAFKKEQQEMMNQIHRQMQNGGRVSMPLPPENSPKP